MRHLLVTCVATALLLVLPGVASAPAPGTSVVYSSLVSSPLHGNMPSLGAEAYAFSELGNAVTLTDGTHRSLSNVVVTMSSWGCQSGHWYSADCLTTGGA